MMDKSRMNVLFQAAMKYAHDNPKSDSNMASIALYKFGELVEKEAEKEEREACAEIAENQRYAQNISLTTHPAQNGTAVGIAHQIRARGEST